MSDVPAAGDTVRGSFRSRVASSVFVLLLVALAPSAALSQESPSPTENPDPSSWTLTEAELLRLVDAVPLPDERRAVEAQAIDAEVAQGRVVDDPVLSYGHRQLLTEPIVTEGELAVSVTADLSDRRDAWLRVGEAAERAADARVALARRDLRVDAREHYFELVAATARLEAHATGIAQLESGLVALTQREAAGDAALWERLRLEREIANARAERTVLDAEREDIWVTMRDTLVLADPTLALDAPETPQELLPEPVEAPADDWLDGHPSSIVIEAARAEATARRATSESPWLRGWEFSAGYTYELVEDVDAHGFVAGIGVPLRFSDPLEPEREAADAEAAAAELDASILARTLSASADARLERARALRAEAVSFAEAAEADIAALSTAVDAGYAGGEIDLVELLDMARATYDTQVLAIELRAAARVASLRFDALVRPFPGDTP